MTSAFNGDTQSILAKEATTNDFTMDHVSPAVRTLMASVVGSLEILRNGSLGELLPHQQRILGVACRNANQLIAMMDDIFVSEKILRNEFSVIRTEISVTEILNSASAFVQAIHSDKGIRWKVDFSASLGFVMADSVQLQKAIVNIIANAAQFTSSPGSVSIRAHREFGAVVVEISDTGVGIPEEEIQFLGRPFFQSSRTKVQGEGVGLGFAVAKEIVQRHDGTIEVGSDESGTVVRISLPAVDNADERPLSA